jgi:hypothetical protein
VDLLRHYGVPIGDRHDDINVVREQLGGMIDDVAGRQTMAEDLGVEVGGRYALDSTLVPSHALNSVHLLGGNGLEVACARNTPTIPIPGLSPLHVPGLYVEFAGQVRASPGGFGAGPLLGLTYETANYGGTFRLALLGRAGYQLGSGGTYDVIDRANCANLSTVSSQCMLLQGGAALILGNALRVQGLYEVAPGVDVPLVLDHFLLEIGLQYDWPLGATAR